MKGPALNLPKSPLGDRVASGKIMNLNPMSDLLNCLIQGLERAPLLEIRGEDIPCRAKNRAEGKLSCQGLLDHDRHARDIPDQEEHVEEAGVV